ncbi:hypothetical protein WICPIJ_008089 [Wickerhamomyces pijperi]|uniref:Uncharacterized protein n=1 Tax=Wickerhamomyces pijperi TaxID=599730 RepID=A0A9P8PYV4_WICPI|nr:hypothetical protein WICPIJ_008089 [Wickerhamomyces pijperi]
MSVVGFKASWINERSEQLNLKYIPQYSPVLTETMCIFVFSTSCKQYPFILISNRDEYFKRQTECASQRTYKDQQIVCPVDSERHGTWLAVNLDKNKISVLVNYREKTRILSEGVSNISRGVLPLEAVTTDARTRKDFINELSSKWKGADFLQNIGGFSLFFGDLLTRKFDIISNKNEDDFKFYNEDGIDSKEVKTYGMSNSSYDEPWPKVKTAEALLKAQIEALEKNQTDKDTFIQALLGVLTTSSIEPSASYIENYDDIPKTIFVPPLETEITVDNRFQGRYYGTRTQTVILVDRDDKLTFVERNLHSSDDLSMKPTVQKFEAQLKSA